MLPQDIDIDLDQSVCESDCSLATIS